MDTGYDTVICYKGMVFTSKKNDLESAIDFINAKVDLFNYAASTNLLTLSISKLYLKLNIKFIYAYNVEERALKILTDNGTKVLYETLIKNGENKTYFKFDELVDNLDIDKSYEAIVANL